MADLTALRRSPVQFMADEIKAAAAPGERSVWLLEWPFLSMVNIRVEPGTETAARIEAVLGTTLPARVGEITGVGSHSVLWLAPDEWLVVSQAKAEPLVEALRAAIGDGHAQVVDVSANRTVLELAGPGAREVLEKGCPTDLHPRAFADGVAITTTIARVPVLLWKVDENLFRVMPRASLAPYVASWLVDAMQELVPTDHRTGGS